MALDARSQTPAPHSGSQLDPSTPADPRRSHSSPGSCTTMGTLCSKPSTGTGEEGAPRTAVASRKRGAENAGAEITAQVVTSSSAAAPSLGGHCHPGAHLPPLSMARAAQASLAEHLQLPQAKLTPLDHPEPPGQDKGILRKAGFHLKNSLLRARSGTGQEGSSVLPFQIWGSWGAEAERAQAPPPRLAAQAATMEGRDCREQEISFSQPKSTLKGQNPQTVPKSQGWRWEGTAAWQQQGTDQSCPSQQLQQLQPSHCSPWGAAHGRAGLRGDMGKQKWAVENRLDESHGQSRSCCDT